MSDLVATRPQKKPISSEERNEIWTQRRLQWRHGVKYGWKPVDGTKCFECLEHLGIFKIRNNTYGCPYPAHIWKGKFHLDRFEDKNAIENGLLKRKRPQRGLLEIAVRDWDNAEVKCKPVELEGHTWDIEGDDDYNIVSLKEDVSEEVLG